MSQFAAPAATAVFISRRTLDVLDTASESGGCREHREGSGKTDAATRHLIIIDQALPVLRRLNAIRKRSQEPEAARDARRVARQRPGAQVRPPNRPLDQRWLLIVTGDQGGSILIATPGITIENVREQMGQDSERTTERVYRHQFHLDRSVLVAPISKGYSTMKAAATATATVTEGESW